jgi:biopolymer transport protein ExbD
MRIPTVTRRTSLGVNMTPMIDIVFQLIIFFLVASHLAQQEVELELSLPQAQSGRSLQEDQGRRLTVNVNPSGEILLAGKKLHVDEFRRIVQYEHAQHGDQVEVRVRCDRRVPYQAVDPILLACAQSGVWDVTFAVIREPGK